MTGVVALVDVYVASIICLKRSFGSRSSGLKPRTVKRGRIFYGSSGVAHHAKSNDH